MIKPHTKISGKRRSKFKQSFRREAVGNWTSSGKSAEVIAQELGIKAERLDSWRRGCAHAAALLSQLDAVLRENKHLHGPRDTFEQFAVHSLQTSDTPYSFIEINFLRDDLMSLISKTDPSANSSTNPP